MVCLVKSTTMKSTLLTVAIGLVVLIGTGCDKLKSRDALNHGVQAYRGAKYADAVEYFKTAVALDPANLNGRLFLLYLQHKMLHISGSYPAAFEIVG